MRKHKIDLIGVPSGLGANINGSAHGPASYRAQGLQKRLEKLGHSIRDLGDLAFAEAATKPEQLEKNGKHLHEITQMCSELAEKTYASKNEGAIPLMLGGDHSLAIGSVSGVSRYYKERGESLGLIWFDAHADVNTPESSPSGNIHGMPLATLLGKGFDSLTSVSYSGAKVAAKNVCLLGIRCLDEEEKTICRNLGLRYFTMREIDERGMAAVTREALATLEHCAGVHLSFDLDGIDPLYAPGVSTAVPGGVSYREARLLLELLAETDKLSSVDFVELNPQTDKNSRTSELAIALL